MPKPKRGPRLGGGPAHQRQMMDGMAAELFVRGRIRTTEAKAKTLRPHAEKLITKARRGDLHARRQVLARLRDRDVVAYLFEEVAPRFAGRPGGYTRILKLGPRQGDNAPMALIELVDRGERGAGEDFVEEARDRRSRGLIGRLRSRFGRGGGEEDLMAGLDLPEAGDEEPGEPESEQRREATPPPEEEPGPAKEPSAPDRRSPGAPVDTAPGGDAAGAEASGKDAGSG